MRVVRSSRSNARLDKGSALSVLAAYLCIALAAADTLLPAPAGYRALLLVQKGLVFLHNGVSSATCRVYMLKDETYKGLWLA